MVSRQDRLYYSAISFIFPIEMLGSIVTVLCSRYLPLPNGVQSRNVLHQAYGLLAAFPNRRIFQSLNHLNCARASLFSRPNTWMERM